MADAGRDAAPACRLIFSLARFVEELEQWCTAHGTCVQVDVRPDTLPFPTLLVVTATGAPVNVLAGSRVLWWERSEKPPDGIFHAGYQVLGPSDAPKLTAATLGRQLARWDAR